jgi:hypothetical protein
MLKPMMRDTLFSYLRGCGYEVHPISPSQRLNKHRFYEAEHEARLRFEALGSELQMAQPFTLEEKYSKKAVFGKRHHSMDVDACEPYMDDQDRRYTKRLFEPFERYDARKDMYVLPKWPLEQYQNLLDRFVPSEILV